MKKVDASIRSDCEKTDIMRSAGVQNVVHAMIVAEDRRYSTHRGVDLISMIRAASRAISGKRLEGASTIEQQFVRTARARYEITFRRKISECIIAIFLSSRHSKKLIAYSYLEIAYFGWRANGVHQAAERLGVNLQDASKHEAAALAAMLKIPMPRFPSEKYIARHADRVAYILNCWEKVEEKYGFAV